MKRSFALAAMTLAVAMPFSAGAQTLTNLANQPPDGAYITMQMTDGTTVFISPRSTRFTIGNLSRQWNGRTA